MHGTPEPIVLPMVVHGIVFDHRSAIGAPRSHSRRAGPERGGKSRGLARLLSYAAHTWTGKVSGRAIPRVTRRGRWYG
jgi:hypothetical protein